MTYTREFDAASFPWWGGAENVVAEVRKHGKMPELQELIEETFAEKIPEATEINDFVWCDKSFIYTQLDIDENCGDGSTKVAKAEVI